MRGTEWFCLSSKVQSFIYLFNCSFVNSLAFSYIRLLIFCLVIHSLACWFQCLDDPSSAVDLTHSLMIGHHSCYLWNKHPDQTQPHFSFNLHCMDGLHSVHGTMPSHVCMQVRYSFRELVRDPSLR